MSEKYKNTGNYLNYVERLLILASTVTGCASTSAFALFASVSVSIVSVFAVGLKIMQSLQRLKSINQLSRKRRVSMVK